MSWKHIQIGALLQPVPKTQKVPSSAYQQNGHTPIIDQSKKEIAGYTDSPTARFESPLPVVLFGDHTRVLKYLDVPFARGAQGTQILITDPKQVLSRYLFYALHTVDLSSYGYTRHFKYLKEQSIPVPPMRVQQSIIDTLSTYDALIQNNKQRMTLLEESLQLLYRKWFLLPAHKEWKKSTVGAILTKVPRKTSVPKNKYQAKGPIPIIDQSSTFIGGYTDNQEALYDQPLPLIVFGDHTRVVKFIDFPFARGADGTQLLCPNHLLSPQLLYCALSHIDLSSFGYTRHLKHLKAQSIWVPPKEINQRFDSHATPILRQIHTLRIQNKNLHNTQKLLMAKLMPT